MARRVRNYRLFLLLPVLAACVGGRGVMLPDISRWENRRAVLESTDDWEFAGRMAVTAVDEGFNGKLWWRQEEDDLSARISGPLGIGTLRISGDGSGLALTDKDGVVAVLDDPEADLLVRYGWTIPVTSLRYWVLGIPDPALPAVMERNEAGQLGSLEQGRWQVTFGQYADGGGQSMPRRLSAMNGDIKVRLVIDRWTFH